MPSTELKYNFEIFVFKDFYFLVLYTIYHHTLEANILPSRHYIYLITLFTALQSACIGGKVANSTAIDFFS